MRYSLKEIPSIVLTPVGRRNLLLGQRHNLWPLLRRLAGLHRRTRLRNTRIVAVVGSYGKSTTTRAVSVALGKQVGEFDKSNAWSGLALALLGTRPQEPHGVLEVGIARRNNMSIYAKMLKPDIVVVTSIGSEHHRSLGTLENTRAEKAEMVRALSPTGIAVINGDDPNVAWMAGETSARVIRFGFGQGNDIRASDYSIVWPAGNRFTVHAGTESRTITSKLIGQHMVYPILAGVAVGLAEGFDFNTILRALEGLEPTAGRLQKVPLSNGAILLRDDFKGALETLESALTTLSQIPAKRKIVCLGEIEDAPGKSRPIYKGIGRQLAETASKVLFICSRDNFRKYRVGATQTGMPKEALIYLGRDWAIARDHLQNDLAAGDAVLIKGRHEQRLERIGLALQGTTVRCNLTSCRMGDGPCSLCGMLGKEWKS